MHPMLPKMARADRLMPLAFLSPLALLPFMDVPMPGVSEVLFCTFALLHVMVVPAVCRQGRGRPSKTLGAAIKLMLPAVVGNTALTFFMVVNADAVMRAQSVEPGCGMAAIAIFFAPFFTIAFFITVGIVLGGALAMWDRVSLGLDS